jgi:hypothetical protein
MIVQDAVGLAMIDNRKAEYAVKVIYKIPFTSDLVFKFDSLLKNFTFKFAIMQHGSRKSLQMIYLAFFTLKCLSGINSRRNSR